MSDVWYWLDHPPADPAWNMAVDEALLRRVSEWGVPVFRSYDWNSPAATFGWFQRYADIASWTDRPQLLRRPTAGGLVLHGEDWTYCVAFPPRHPWYGMRPADSYCRLHRWLKDVFLKQGVQTELAADPDTRGPGICFVGAERADLLFDGRKLAGAAQRRNRLGFLIQGSIQPVPAGVSRVDYFEQLRRDAERNWEVEWRPFPHRDLLEEQANQLLEERYSKPEYHRMR